MESEPSSMALPSTSSMATASLVLVSSPDSISPDPSAPFDSSEASNSRQHYQYQYRRPSQPVRVLPSSSPSAAAAASPPLPSPAARNTETSNLDFTNQYPPTTAVWHTRSQTLDTVLPPAHEPVVPPSSRFSTGPVKRKPLSSRASLLAVGYLNRASHPSPILEASPRLDNVFDGSPSASFSLIDSQISTPAIPSIATAVELHPQRRPTIDGVATRPETNLSDSFDTSEEALSDIDTPIARDAASTTEEVEEVIAHPSHVDPSFTHNFLAPSSPMFAAKPSPPHLRLEKVNPAISQQEELRTAIDESPQSTVFGTLPVLNKPLPRSPGQASPLGSAFGWGGSSPALTEASSIRPASLAHDGRRSTKGSFAEDNKTDAASIHNQYLSTPTPTSPAFSLSNSSTLVDDMEDELKAISSELAASIRREMDLEDLCDRLQEQLNNSQAPNKRSSDYFSDSGYSSTKLSDYDQSREEIDKIQRKSEQEKASIRLELVNKLQDERSKRKVLNHKIKELAEKASHVDIAQINSLDANDRIKNLEDTCEDLKRKLSEERLSKSSFEDLLTALKGQLQEVSDERDNLREEVIPQLRARIEGLETEAAGYTGLTYESARMQQQLESLRQENSSLRSSINAGPEDLSKRVSMGLSRSNSLGPSSMRGPKLPSPLSRSESVKNVAPKTSLSRSNSFKSSPTTESREDLHQRIKDVEAQRDALHSALKSLLERQEFQNREHQKRIRILENERQRLMTNSPRKAGFQKDMSKLQIEVNILRRRAEEALEQKWQVEKGLGGLKMDLDRAEEEIESLRSLLQEKDILIPPSSYVRSSISDASDREPVSSESLERAFGDLHLSYAESLERLKQLESENEAGSAEELNDSTKRVEDLSSRVKHQLAANADLRERLLEAVSRGETDRTAHSRRIAEMQERLRNLEEQVISAQMASEEHVARYEEEMTSMQESHNVLLHRLQNDNARGGKAGSGPRSLLSARTSMSRFGQVLRPIPTKSFEDEAEMKLLRAKVSELEKTLADTENEMQEVVAKMNMAQVEVLNLQEAREAAIRETRRLEQSVKQEHSKGFGGLFRRA